MLLKEYYIPSLKQVKMCWYLSELKALVMACSPLLLRLGFFLYVLSIELLLSTSILVGYTLKQDMV